MALITLAVGHPGHGQKPQPLGQGFRCLAGFHEVGHGMHHLDRWPGARPLQHPVAGETAAGDQPPAGLKIGLHVRQRFAPDFYAVKPAETLGALASSGTPPLQPSQPSQPSEGLKQQGVHAQYDVGLGQPKDQLQQEPPPTQQAAQGPRSQAPWCQQTHLPTLAPQARLHLEGQAFNPPAPSHVVAEHKDHRAGGPLLAAAAQRTDS